MCSTYCYITLKTNCQIGETSINAVRYTRGVTRSCCELIPPLWRAFVLELYSKRTLGLGRSGCERMRTKKLMSVVPPNALPLGYNKSLDGEQIVDGSYIHT